MNKEASITVEAAFILPVFLFAMLLYAFLGRMAECQDKVQWALTRVAREASAELGASDKAARKNRASLSKGYYKVKLMKYLDGNGLSVSLKQSRICEREDEIDFIADYRMNLPFRLFSLNFCAFRARVRTRAFTGVEKRGKEDGRGLDREVYIAKTGRVYHDSLSCTYLKLSISQLKYVDVEALRNEGGGKYKPCEKCVKKESVPKGTDVWITNFGDRFHLTRSCSGLKRMIQKIKLSEAGSRTPCSKCAGS